MKTIIKSIKKQGLKTDILEKNATQHVLVKGDCGEIIKYIPDGTIDLIITDPPYNKGLDYGGFNDSKPWVKYYKWLKERHQCLVTFEEKTKCSFSVHYQYHYDEGTVEHYPVAQNIETEEDAKQIVKIFEKYNKDSHVYYVIGSPEI